MLAMTCLVAQLVSSVGSFDAATCSVAQVFALFMAVGLGYCNSPAGVGQAASLPACSLCLMFLLLVVSGFKQFLTAFV